MSEAQVRSAAAAASVSPFAAQACARTRRAPLFKSSESNVGSACERTSRATSRLLRCERWMGMRITIAVPAFLACAACNKPAPPPAGSVPVLATTSPVPLSMSAVASAAATSAPTSATSANPEQPSTPPPRTVAQLLSDNVKDGEVVELRAYYVHPHSLSIEDPVGPGVPRAVIDAWQLELSDDPTRTNTALCNLPRNPGIAIGRLVTVKGPVHLHRVLNPCTVLDPAPRASKSAG